MILHNLKYVSIAWIYRYKKNKRRYIVTTTEKGDEICNRLLIELITFAKLSDIAPKLLEPNLSIEHYKVSKGIRSAFLRENANLHMVAERLTDNILEINSHFNDEIKGIDDEL